MTCTKQNGANCPKAPPAPCCDCEYFQGPPKTYQRGNWRTSYGRLSDGSIVYAVIDLGPDDGDDTCIDAKSYDHAVRIVNCLAENAS